MTLFADEKFSGDFFEVFSLKKEEAVQLVGKEYSISESLWRAEKKLPDEYEVAKLALREFSDSPHSISWSEVDMILHLDPGLLRVGWRPVIHLYRNQHHLPLSWMEHMIGGGIIIFPYAVCYRRIPAGGPLYIHCPVFWHDPVHRYIRCEGVLRNKLEGKQGVAVYQI